MSCVKNMPNYMMCWCNGSNCKILAYNKKDTDPHVEVNCRNVSTRE